MDTPSPHKLDRKPTAWSEFYDGQVNVRRIHALIGTQWPLIQRILKLPANSKLLEIGVGSGIMACYLSNLGYDITAIDNDEKVLLRASDLAQRLCSKLTLVEMDMFELGFRNREFDATYHQGVLEHFSAPQIQAAVAAQLKVSGRLIFSVPSRYYPWKSFGDENLWHIRKWRDILSAFRVEEVFGYDFISSHRLERGFQRAMLYLWPSLCTHLKSMQYGFVITP